MDFIAGLIIGTIIMMGITTLKLSNKGINSNIDTQPEFRPIATQKEVEKLQEELLATENELVKVMSDRTYWQTEAIKNCSRLGEKLMEECKELSKKVDDFREEYL